MAETLVDKLYEPLPLTKERAQEIASFFTTQVTNARSDRKQQEARWEWAIRLYEGKREIKNSPWYGASNTHIPMLATHASAIHARFMTTLFSPEPFWRVRSRSSDYQDFCDAASEYMDWSRQNEFSLYDAVRDWAWDAIKLGVGILKVTYRKTEGEVIHYKKDANGVYRIVKETTVLEDRPHVEAISPTRFVWPAGYADVQTCPWVAEIQYFTKGEMLQMIKEKKVFNGEWAISAEQSTTIRDRVEYLKGLLEGIIPSNKPGIEVWEVWARYDVNGDDVEENVKLLIEPMSQTILAATLNPYFHQLRPFVVGRLESREHSINGIGVADQIGDLNEELNTVHNQMVDATTVSICSMFGVRAGSPAADALNKIHPGKLVPLTQADDVKEITLGPLKVTSFPLEASIQAAAEKRTGISDFNLGREPTPSRRGTATGTLAIIQEGNKKFDFQIRDLREGLGRVGMMLLSILQQNNPRGITREVLGPDGSQFEILKVDFPEAPVHQILSVEVVAGSSTVNRQVQRQDALSLFQLLMAFYMQAFQLGQQLSQPGMPPAMINLSLMIAKGAETMMKEILNSFENRRFDELIPNLEEVYAQIAAGGLAQGIAQAAGLGGLAGGVGGDGGAGPQAGGDGSGGAGPSQVPSTGLVPQGGGGDVGAGG